MTAPTSPWQARLIEALGGLQPCPPHRLRLFRVEADRVRPLPDWMRDASEASGASAAQGRWFTDDPAALCFYAEDVTPPALPVLIHLDVDRRTAAHWRVSVSEERLAGRRPRDFSRDPEREFFVPTEQRLQAGRIPLAPTPRPRARRP